MIQTVLAVLLVGCKWFFVGSSVGVVLSEPKSRVWLDKACPPFRSLVDIDLASFSMTYRFRRTCGYSVSRTV